MGYYYDDYWRNPDPAVCFVDGFLRTRLVARLAGTTTQQLARWHSTRQLTAAFPGRRGVARRYSWVEYSKARAFVKLRDAGVPRESLAANVEWLDAHLPRWFEIPLVPLPTLPGQTRERSPNGGLACHAGAMGEWIAAKLVERPAARASMIEPDALAHAIADIDAEGPLGALSEYGDAVNMDPRIMGGFPVVRGTRIETAMLAALAGWGRDAGAIASDYELDAQLVKRALAFETTLAA